MRLRSRVAATAVGVAALLAPIATATAAHAGDNPTISNIHASFASTTITPTGAEAIGFSWNVDLPASYLCDGQYYVYDASGQRVSGGYVDPDQRSLTLPAGTWPGTGRFGVSYDNCDPDTGGHGYSDASFAAKTINQTALAYSTGWKNEQSSSSFAGDQKFTTKVGASATYNNHIWSDFQIIAGMSARGGTIKVYLDGTMHSTISLYSSTTRSRQVVYRAFSTDNHVHNIKIVNVSPNSNYRVSLDAVATVKQR